MKVKSNFCIKASHISLQRGLLSFDYKQIEIQLCKLYTNYAHEVDVKNVDISSCQKEQNSWGWVN